MQGVIDHAEEIGGKVGENLREALDAIPLSKDLVTIRCDLELEQDIAVLKSTEPDQQKLIELYSELEFKKWLEELGAEPVAGHGASPTAKAEVNYQCIFEQAEFDKWVEKLAASDGFAFDTETTSLGCSAG